MKTSRKKPLKKNRRTVPASKTDDDAFHGTDYDGEDDVAESKFFNDGKGTNKTRPTRSKTKLEDEEEYQDDQEEPRRSGKKVYDSDALDEESDFEDAYGKKRKRKSTPRSSPKKVRSPKKKRKTEDGDEEDYEDDLPDGQEIVGKVIQAPSTGRVPPGQISQNTLDFLYNLKKPECNDRQWFKLHEPVYRQAEQEWKDFVEAFTDLLIEVDSQIPHLPPKDVIHRIYRDMRFSNDKTPYKKALSASFSRSGRKGIFAGYHIANILRNPQRLRRVISSPDFVKYFGKPEPHPKGEQQNIFGQEGELKTAPKGIDKDHKDIDLLKCRSFCVSYRFPDSEVLSPDFKDKLATVSQVLQPFVHCLNDMMTIMSTEDGDDSDNGDEEQGEDGEEEQAGED